MTKAPNPADPIRTAALRALALGLLTFDEVVKASGVSRWTLYRWCAEAKIDPRRPRFKRVNDQWVKMVKEADRALVGKARTSKAKR